MWATYSGGRKASTGAIMAPSNKCVGVGGKAGMTLLGGC